MRLLTPLKPHVNPPGTPGLETTDRYHFQLNDEDSQKIGRGRPWSATITDQTTGQRFLVEGCECSLPRCYCDARVVQEL